MSEVYEPNADLRDRAHVKSMDEYREEYVRSIADPEAFWAAKAAEFHWFKKWDTVRSYNYDMDAGPIAIEWFAGGQTNITYNCLDRHLDAKGDQVAIIWEGNEPGEDATLTYRELHEQVCKFANVLKARGVKKGDRVSIYLPMVPELAIAMLACARIGAIHSIVFGGFSADALADRIVDSTCTTVITCNGTHRGDKPILMKPVADQAMADADARMDAEVATCIVVDRADFDVGYAGWSRLLVARADGRCGRRLCLRGHGCRGSALHPLYLRVHGPAQGRAAHGRRVHGLYGHHAQVRVRLPRRRHLFLRGRHRLGHRPLVHHLRPNGQRRDHCDV